MEAADARDAAEASQQLRRKQLSEERGSERPDGDGVPGSRALSTGTLATCATWLDQTSVLTAHGQACCRLALAFSLVPRLCSDEFPDGLVPEPELLQRIGRHLHDQAVQQKADELQQIKARAVEILDGVMPECHAAYDGLQSLCMVDMVEAREFTATQCRPVCEAVCLLMDTNPEIVGTESGGKTRDYVRPFRRMCMDTGRFVQSMLHYDKDNIRESQIEAVEKVIEDDVLSLDPNRLDEIGKAYAAFARWAKAMVCYHHASKVIEPYREALTSGEADLQQLVAARKSITTD